MNEQYTLCIIDDMEHAVESLVKNIPWSQYGITIAGTATDGKEGLDLVLRTKPDIVLTDIRMPHLDGLEMVAELLNELPECKIIIMSGYRDFEYAQKALRLGASDYLIKPLTPNEIGNTMNKVLEASKKKRDHQSHTEKMERKVYESMPLFKREQLNMLIRYETTQELAEKRWLDLELNLGSGQFVVMVAEVDHWSSSDQQIKIQDVEMIRFAIQNIWEETIGEYAEGIVFPDAYGNRIVSIVNYKKGLDMKQIGEASRVNIRNYSKNTVSIGMSKAVSLAKLPLAYNQALTALSYNFYTGGDSLFYFSDQPLKTITGLQSEPELEQELLLSLRAGNAKKMADVFEQIVDRLCDLENPVAPDEMILKINEWLILIKRELKAALPLEQMANVDQEISDMIHAQFSTVHQMKLRLNDLCEAVCDLIQHQQEDEAHRLINTAIEFIDQSLADNLTISDYASHVHLSASYFSSLFKKIKGMTVHQYVTNKKIQLAQHMLLEDQQVQEIAANLGFENRRYFSEVFKKMTGKTPTEFKQQYEDASNKEA